MNLLVTVDEVTRYTSFQSVANRPSAKLEYDIFEAQVKVFQWCGHRFNDLAKYPTLPDEVKLAIMQLAEYHALKNSDEAFAKGYTSEKIGDYQYQIGESTHRISLQPLLADHIMKGGKDGARVRFRKV